MRKINLLVLLLFSTVTSIFAANQTYNWIQMTQYITYAANGTEASRMEYTYDTEGRETGYKSFINGTLSQQYRDYQYNGRTITCWLDTYTSGSVSASMKIQRTYSDLNWIQMTQQIQYATNGTEFSRMEYTYDAEGRETGYKSFSYGKLAQQYRDYQYNGQTITSWFDMYTAGSLNSSFKIQRTYREVISKTGIDVKTACESYTWIDGKTYTASNNTATHKLVAKNGNDSIVTLNLTINYKPAVTASLQNGSLVASTSNDTYQWLNCDANTTAIANAKKQTFLPTQTGNYAVKVSSKGCEATSACVKFEAQTTGLNKDNYLEFSIYPNPTQGVFNITGLPTGTYKILNLMGASVFQFTVESTDAQLLNLSHLAKGLYQISTEDLKIMHNKVVITD